MHRIFLTAMLAACALWLPTEARATAPPIELSYEALGSALGGCSLALGATCSGVIVYTLQTPADMTSFEFMFEITGVNATIVQARTTSSCTGGMTTGTWKVTSSEIAASCTTPSSQINCRAFCLVAAVVIQCDGVGDGLATFSSAPINGRSANTFNGNEVPTGAAPIHCYATPGATHRELPSMGSGPRGAPGGKVTPLFVAGAGLAALAAGWYAQRKRAA